LRQDGSKTKEVGQKPPMSKQTVLIHKASLSLDAANSTTTDIDSDWELSSVLVHFSGASNSTVTLNVDSNEGADYDTVIWTRTLTNDTDLAILYDEGELQLNKGDELKISFTIDAGIIAYVTIYYKLR